MSGISVRSSKFSLYYSNKCELNLHTVQCTPSSSCSPNSIELSVTLGWAINRKDL